MTITELQQRLAALGFYKGDIDGGYGAGTRAALLACLKAGPDTKLSPADVSKAAALLGTTPAHIRTVVAVEAAGAGFYAGLPKILFEGHIFSRLTKGRFDRTHPRLSYPKWDKSKYPNTQDARYAQLLDAVALDPDAAFASASYGAFQILGQNFKVCGSTSEFEFVLAQCQTEGHQLLAFVGFVKGNKLDDALRNERWAEFARGYNGSAYKLNAYDTKLAQAYAREKVKGDRPTLSGTAVALNSLNVRDKPGGAVEYVLPIGAFVAILMDMGEWVHVNYAPGKDGYVAAAYLSPAPAAAVALTGVARAVSDLNIRKSPGGDIIYVLPKGKFVNILAHQGEWVKVNFAQGHDGFAVKDYLTKA